MPVLRDYISKRLKEEPWLGSTDLGEKFKKLISIDMRVEQCHDLDRGATQFIGSTQGKVSPAMLATFVAKLLKTLPTFDPDLLVGRKSYESEQLYGGVSEFLKRPGYTEILDVYFAKGYISGEPISHSLGRLLADPDRIPDLKVWVGHAKRKDFDKNLVAIVKGANDIDLENLKVFGAPGTWSEALKDVMAWEVHTVYKCAAKRGILADPYLDDFLVAVKPYMSEPQKVTVATAAFHNSDMRRARFMGVPLELEARDLIKVQSDGWDNANDQLIELVDFIKESMPQLDLTTREGFQLFSTAAAVGYEPTKRLLEMGAAASPDSFDDAYSKVIGSNVMTMEQKNELLVEMVKMNLPLKVYDDTVYTILHYTALPGASYEVVETLLTATEADVTKVKDSIFPNAAAAGNQEIVEKVVPYATDASYFKLGLKVPAMAPKWQSDQRNKDECLICAEALIKQFPEKRGLILGGLASSRILPTNAPSAEAKNAHWRKQIDTIKELKERGADLNYTAVHHGLAFKFQNANKKIFIDFLRVAQLSPEAINAPDNNGETLVSVAASRGESQTIQVLHKMGADLNLPDKNGDTPFLKACKGQNLATINILEKLGADITITNEKGAGPLYMAALSQREANREVLERLCELKCPAAAPANASILGLLSGGGNLYGNIFESLLQAGCDPNAISEEEPVGFKLSSEQLKKAIPFGLNIFSQDKRGRYLITRLPEDDVEQVVDLFIQKEHSLERLKKQDAELVSEVDLA